VLDEDKKDRSESIGIKAQITQHIFVFLLHALEPILATTNILSEQLQAQNLDLSSAVNLIQGTRTELISYRCEDYFDKLVNKAKSVSEDCGTDWSTETKRRKTAIPMKFNTDVVYSTVGQHQRDSASCTGSENRKSKLKRIYFHILDQILAEFDRRFTNN